MTTRLKVLVVEDDRTVQDVLETLLRFDGCEVTVVGDGEAALDAVGRDRPDVVLLDVMMPGLDGFEVCRRLKDRPNAPKVVMVTAKTGPQDQRTGLQAGADAYLGKPFSPLELLRAVGIGEGSGAAP